MLKPTHSPLIYRKAQVKLAPLYAVMLLLIFHSNVTIYLNSTYLSTYIPEASVGTIYTMGAAVSLILFLFISRVLHRVGNYRLIMSLLVLDFFAVLLIGTTSSAQVLILLFLVHYISLPLIFFNLDVFIEAKLDNIVSSTGTKRGLLLALSGFVAMVSPIIMGVTVSESANFLFVYILSALSLIPIFFLLKINFKQFSDPPYSELDIFKALSQFWRKRNIRLVFLARLFLEIFFAFTVIYYPIYLTQEIGLSWESFGVIMGIALSAYMILEYPVGVLADNYIGEKEMMATGFLIITLTVAATSFITSASVVLWAGVMFMSRVGASMVEATTESYFFKKTSSSDAQVISFFRATRPLSYVLGALGASFALVFLPFNLLFIAAAFAMVPAMFLVSNLEDTK